MQGRENSDILLFDTWYNPSDIEKLIQSVEPKEFLFHIFLDDQSIPSTVSFEKHLKILIELNKALPKASNNKFKGISFICKEPGAGQNHFIFGTLLGNTLTTGCEF